MFANPVSAGGINAEWFKEQQLMALSPSGSQFDDVYVMNLYEVLMASIGKTGTFANFQLNTSAMDQIVKVHYVDEICLRDFSEQYTKERKIFFEPIFCAAFNKTGI